MYKLVVWTRVQAEQAAVWDLCTDPAELASLLPRWVRWEISDPEGLRRGLRDGGGAVVRSRLRLGGRLLEWPVRVIDAQAPLRGSFGGENAWFARLDVRVRCERAMGGRVRVVHEVVADPRRGGAWTMRLLAWALRRVHQGIAARLAADGEVGAWRLFDFAGEELAHLHQPLHDGEGA